MARRRRAKRGVQVVIGVKQFGSAFICKTQVLLFAGKITATACRLIGSRQLDSVSDRDISTFWGVSGTRAGERVGGWSVESAGERWR